MARQIIDTETQNPGWVGDIAKIAFTKTNENFKEIYDELGEGGSIAARIPGKNRLINGNMQFAQRTNNGTVLNAAAYTADRWRCSAVGSSACNWGIGGHAAGEVSGATRFLGFNIVAGTTSAWMGQHIEGVDTLAGGAVTVSFYMRSNVPGKKVGVTCQQIFGSGGSSLVAVAGDVITLGSAFQKFVVTLDLPSISGKTVGANSNLLLVFYLCDATVHGGQLANQTGLFEISRVQLEEGATATSFEVRPVGLELMLCQRYYEKSYSIDVYPSASDNAGRCALGNSSNTNGQQFTGQRFKVTKRATPSVTVYPNNNVNGAPTPAGFVNQDDNSRTAVSVVNQNSNGFEIIYSNGPGRWGGWYHFVADAEL